MSEVPWSRAGAAFRVRGVPTPYTLDLSGNMSVALYLSLSLSANPTPQTLLTEQAWPTEFQQSMSLKYEPSATVYDPELRQSMGLKYNSLCALSTSPPQQSLILNCDRLWALNTTVYEP